MIGGRGSSADLRRKITNSKYLWNLDGKNKRIGLTQTLARSQICRKMAAIQVVQRKTLLSNTHITPGNFTAFSRKLSRVLAKQDKKIF